METIETRNPERDLARAEARLPRWMLAGTAVGVLVALASGHARIVAGFALGAAVAILNYYWLHQAVETLFAAARARVPKIVAAKFALRYPLVFAGVYCFYKTGWLPFGAILAGLFVPVMGVIIESVVQICEGLGAESSTLTPGS